MLNFGTAARIFQPYPPCVPNNGHYIATFGLDKCAEIPQKNLGPNPWRNRYLHFQFSICKALKVSLQRYKNCQKFVYRGRFPKTWCNRIQNFHSRSPSTQLYCSVSGQFSIDCTAFGCLTNSDQ